MAMRNPIGGAVFGQERTAKQALDRAQWERDQAAKLRALRTPIGYEHIAEGHDKAARAYEQAAKDRANNAPATSLLTPREINEITRASDGRNVYLLRNRLDHDTIHRVSRARTKDRVMEVRDLGTGRWLPVMPELGDRIEVR